jgi:hypothetical protein
MQTRWRAGLAAAAATAVVVVPAGCGSGPPTVSSRVVSDAVAATSGSTGFRISLNGSVDVLGRHLPLSGSGVIDPRVRRGAISIDLSSFAALGAGLPGGARVQEILAGPVVYMRAPFLGRLLPKGKTWLKLDVRALGQKLGINLNQLSQFGGGDPRQALDQLRAVSGDVKKLGKDTVRGVQTTHYRATIDLRRYVRLVPPAQRAQAEASVKRLIQLSGTSGFPEEIWIDSHRLVRRIRLTYSFKPRNVPGNQKVSFDENLELFDFGASADVAPPPASQTVDLTQLATQFRNGQPGFK